MEWETLPAWVWVMYYALLAATLGASIWSVARMKGKIVSVMAIVAAVTVPAVAIVFSIGRLPGTNELEHLIKALRQGAPWALYVTAGYLYLAGWWAWFLVNRKQATIAK